MLNQKLSSKIETNKLIGYILSTGDFFNLFDINISTHARYESELIKQKELNKPQGRFYRQITNLRQWIRINDGTNVAYEVLAELPIKGVTEEQYKSLEQFLDYLRGKGKKSIDIGIEEHSIGTHFTDKSLWYSTFDLSTFNNKEIVYCIRDAYRTLEMYPSN